MSVIRDFIGLVRAGVKSTGFYGCSFLGLRYFPFIRILLICHFGTMWRCRSCCWGWRRWGNLVLGYGGMVSFGHAAFIGIGAYCAGISQFMASPTDGRILALVLRHAALRVANRISCTAHKRNLFHHDHAGFCTNAIFLFVSLEPMAVMME